jgi:AraC-like DNA-binding protein
MATVFTTTDPDVAHALLQEQYTTLRLTTTGERTGLAIVQHGLGPVRLDRISFTMAAEVDADPLLSLCIGRIRAGRVTYRHDRRGDVSCGPGTVVLVCQPDADWGALLDRLDAEFAFLDPGLLSEVARTGHDTVPELLGYTPVSTAAARLWWHSYSYARAIAADTVIPTNDLIIGATARLLATTALQVFPHTALLEPTIEDRRDAHPESLRRAIAFIEANPQHDLTAAAIAAAASVTIRAVQLAFRRHLDTTPMAYLRRVRLHLAHHDLVLADPSTDSVTAIGARWGFANPSHFATLYRQEFGRSPRHTLGQ